MSALESSFEEWKRAAAGEKDRPRPPLESSFEEWKRRARLRVFPLPCPLESSFEEWKRHGLLTILDRVVHLLNLPLRNGN